MQILVFNTGSASLKFQLTDSVGTETRTLLHGEVAPLGENAQLTWRHHDQQGETHRRPVSAPDPAAAARAVLALLPLEPDVTAHRIVHGGRELDRTTRISDNVLAAIKAHAPHAPLHNPPALEVIDACLARFPEAPAYAAFDTAWFHDLPPAARDYALPPGWSDHGPLRRYGFHGIAHRQLAGAVQANSGPTPTTPDSGPTPAWPNAGPTPVSRIITLQLGGGCSMAAVRDGRPVETSMGFTPLEGLLMATRAGDVDAGLIAWLLTHTGLDAHELERGLYRESGLLALSGVSGDMRRLLALEADGHAGAQRAIESFCHRARKYLGAYAAVLDGVDAIAFGGGIGQHAPSIRARICDGLAWCGVEIDDTLNADPDLPPGSDRPRSDPGSAGSGAQLRSDPGSDPGVGPRCISAPASTASIWVVPVDEASAIAADVAALLSADAPTRPTTRSPLQ